MTHEVGDIIMTLALIMPFGYREVPWSVCHDAYRDAYGIEQIVARCAVYDPDGKLDLPAVSGVDIREKSPPKMRHERSVIRVGRGPRGT